MKIIALNSIKLNTENKSNHYNNGGFHLPTLKSDTVCFTGSESKIDRIQDLVDLYNKKDDYKKRLIILNNAANKFAPIAGDFFDIIEKGEKEKRYLDAIEHYRYIAQRKLKVPKDDIEVALLSEIDNRALLNHVSARTILGMPAFELSRNEKTYIGIAKNQRLLPRVREFAAIALAEGLQNDEKHFLEVYRDLMSQKEPEGRTILYSQIFSIQHPSLIMASNATDLLSNKGINTPVVRQTAVQRIVRIYTDTPNLFDSLPEGQLFSLEQELKKEDMIQDKNARLLLSKLYEHNNEKADAVVKEYFSCPQNNDNEFVIQSELMGDNPHYISKIKSIIKNTKESSDKRIDAIDMFSKGCCYAELAAIAILDIDKLANIVSISKLKQSDSEKAKECLEWLKKNHPNESVREQI